jgi:hypothetical protein
VLRLALAFVDIALHRRGPQELPASTFLFVLVLVAYLVIAAIALQFAPTLERAAVLLAFETAVYCGFIWGVLKAFNHDQRFKQTATALLGTDALLSLLSLPLLLWTRELDTSGATTTAPDFFRVLLLIWSIDISGFVLSRGIGRPYILGVSIMIGYVLLLISLQVSLFPPVD